MWPFLLPVVCLFPWVFAHQQLLEPSSPRLFTSTPPALSFSASSDELCSALYVDSYALTAWVFFHELPASSQEFLLIQTLPGRSELKAIQSTDGTINFSIQACETSYSLQMTELPTSVWLHIGMSLSSQSQVALVSAISWTGVQVTRVQFLSLSFSVSMPPLRAIVLGGSSPVANKLEMVDARYYTNGLTATEMVTVAGPGFCEVENMGVVPMESCQFYPLVGRNTVLTLNAEIKGYLFPYSRVDTSYSATQWLWFTETDNSGYRSIFRLTQTSSDFGSSGDQVMALFLHKVPTPHSLLLKFDTASTPNQALPELPLPVRVTQAGYQGQWVFVAAAVDRDSARLCYGLQSDVSLTCVSGTFGGVNMPWGTAGTPKIYYGDSFYFSIQGKEVDARYYGTGLSISDFNTVFIGRKLACSLHCQICSSLVTCIQCAPGWYLDASSNCKRCSTCCAGCTGPGKSACTSCAPLCISTSATTCIRKN